MGFLYPQVGISVNIFGRNNEDCIERALKSVQPFANEIIYLDTGSTDKTINIVERYTKQIYRQSVSPFNYSTCRNFLIERSNNEWILALDTDEVVTKELATKIRGFLHFLKFIYRPINFVYYKRVELIQDERHMLTSPDFHPFLFNPFLYKKTAGKWAGTVHESFSGIGEGMFWDIFGHVHYNLLMVDRLRNLKEGRAWAKALPDNELVKLYAHGAPVGEVPTNILW